MRIRYNPLARDEVITAAEYYDSQAEGLGERFLTEIDKVVRDIALSPLLWPITIHGARKRILVSPFPYSILYKIVNGEIVIIAVANQSRQQDYWTSVLVEFHFTTGSSKYVASESRKSIWQTYRNA